MKLWQNLRPKLYFQRSNKSESHASINLIQLQFFLKLFLHMVTSSSVHIINQLFDIGREIVKAEDLWLLPAYCNVQGYLFDR